MLRSLAKNGGRFWFVAEIIPTALLVMLGGKGFGVDIKTIVTIQLPCLVVQVFALFLLVKYPKEVLGR